MLVRIDSLEQDHECAGRHHAEVDRLGQLWLSEGQLAELARHHIGIEYTEGFSFAAVAFSAAECEAIGAEMASRRGINRPPEFHVRPAAAR